MARDRQSRILLIEDTSLLRTPIIELPIKDIN